MRGFGRWQSSESRQEALLQVGGGEDARGDAAVLALMRWRAGVLDMPDNLIAVVDSSLKGGELRQNLQKIRAQANGTVTASRMRSAAFRRIRLSTQSACMPFKACAVDSEPDQMRRQRDLDGCRGVVSATVANLDRRCRRRMEE